jgi:hypothetical protein
LKTCSALEGPKTKRVLTLNNIILESPAVKEKWPVNSNFNIFPVTEKKKKKLSNVRKLLMVIIKAIIFKTSL